jgi:hypothetical protein
MTDINEQNRQLNRLIELENILWFKIQHNEKNNIQDNTLYKLYSDTSFKILRHNAIYNKKANDDDDNCILDDLLSNKKLLNDNSNKKGRR